MGKKRGAQPEAYAHPLLTIWDCGEGPSTLDVARSTFRMILVATDPHVPARHDGGDGVLVDHLAHLVAQQHHELVERLDRALQLDAVHQVNGDRHALASQRVQKRVLQRLPFGHSSSPLRLSYGSG